MLPSMPSPERASRNDSYQELLRKCDQYEIAMEKMRQREAALLHRLVLSETAQSSAAWKLGVSIQEDAVREMTALEDLQDKVAEMEMQEVMKEQLIRDFVRGFRVEKDMVSKDVESILKEIKANAEATFLRVVRIVNANAQGELKSMREAVQSELAEELRALSKLIEDRFAEEKITSEKHITLLLQGMCDLLGLVLDSKLFISAVNFRDGDELHEALKLKFLQTCSIPRIETLEKALDQAQRAEAKAKRLAVRVSQQKDQQLEEEKAKVESLSKKFEAAVMALEKARADFDTVSTLVEAMNKSHGKE